MALAAVLTPPVVNLGEREETPGAVPVELMGEVRGASGALVVVAEELEFGAEAEELRLLLAH